MRFAVGLLAIVLVGCVVPKKKYEALELELADANTHLAEIGRAHV